MTAGLPRDAPVVLADLHESREAILEQADRLRRAGPPAAATRSR